MEAGLFYTVAGPWLAAAALLALVFAAFRHPMGGVLGYVGLVYASPYFTYRDDLQAIGAGAGAVVLLAAALIRRPPTRPYRLTPADWALAAFVSLMAVAGARGLLAAHGRGHLAADVYHYLVAAPILYVSARRLVDARDLPRLLSGFVWISALAAIPAILIIWFASDTELIWLVGAPLDEGGARLKPDFAYPLVPSVVATALLLRSHPRIFSATALLVCALVMTYKRTFWGAYLFGALVVAVLTLGALKRSAQHVLARLAILTLAIGVGIAVAMLTGLNTESAIERGGGLAHPTDVRTVTTRAEELREVLQHVRATPFGYGLGAAPVIPFGDPAGVATHYTHTIYLQWCLQGGIPAAIAGVAFLAIILRGLVRRRNDTSAVALGASVAALALAGFALQSLNSPISALFIGLGANLASREQR